MLALPYISSLHICLEVFSETIFMGHIPSNSKLLRQLARCIPLLSNRDQRLNHLNVMDLPIYK